MDITLILRVAGIGMIIAVTYQILQRSGREEQALLVSLTGIVFVLIVIVGKVGELFGAIRSIFGL